jgi:serine/threonine-protein kinase
MKAVTQSADFKPGQTFGKYTLIDRIAVGGMAEIFLARQAGVEGFEKTIALKKIRPHLSGDENFVRMFLNEAKLAAQLSHPNIVQIYDLGKINDSYFIAMEYISGRDMSRVIPKCKAMGIPFPLEYALKITSATLEALYYAHNKTDAAGHPLHIVHRDATPENILVAFSGSVKIADFGIAKATAQLGDGRADTTKVGEIKGKLSYMSPEQCMGKDVDHRSDVFSLAVVLYEWLTGFKLFSGDNDLAVMNNIIEGKIYPPSYFRDGIPDVVETILMKALEKDRKKRYQSAWDMQFDIDTFLASNEFTPSSIHLSNFMKQLFKDELDKEQEFLARLHSPATRTPVSSQAPATGSGPKPTPPGTTGSSSTDVIELDTSNIVLEEIPVENTPLPLQPAGPVEISVRLDKGAHRRLTELAERKQQTPAELAEHLLNAILKNV